MSYQLHPALVVVAASVALMAVWRDAHSATLQDVKGIVNNALGACGMSGKEAAIDCEMSAQLWSSHVANGVNLTAIVVVASQRPDFAYEFLVRLARVVMKGDRRRDLLDQITRPEVKTCESFESLASSPLVSSSPSVPRAS